MVNNRLDEALAIIRKVYVSAGLDNGTAPLLECVGVLSLMRLEPPI